MEESDRIFAELVAEQELASHEQVEECIEAVRRAAELGAVASLPDTMVNKGYISRKQADAILAKIRSADSKVTSIGGYELIETLGRGAMGVVYKARQVSMNRLVAIKLLRPSLSRNKVFVERFFREARTAAKLDHQNIIRAIDAGYDKGYHYFVMEFVDGPTVAGRLIAFWKHVEKMAAELTPRQNIRVRGKLAQFVSYDNGMIRYKVGPVETGIRLINMKAKDIPALPDLLADNESCLGAAAFLLYDKDADAERALEVIAQI